MKVTCQSCGSSFMAPDEKIRGRIVKYHCRKCSAIIVADGTSLSAPSWNETTDVASSSEILGGWEPVAMSRSGAARATSPRASSPDTVPLSASDVALPGPAASDQQPTTQIGPSTPAASAELDWNDDTALRAPSSPLLDAPAPAPAATTAAPAPFTFALFGGSRPTPAAGSPATSSSAATSPAKPAAGAPAAVSPVKSTLQGTSDTPTTAPKPAPKPAARPEPRVAAPPAAAPSPVPNAPVAASPAASSVKPTLQGAGDVPARPGPPPPRRGAASGLPSPDTSKTQPGLGDSLAPAPVHTPPPPAFQPPFASPRIDEPSLELSAELLLSGEVSVPEAARSVVADENDIEDAPPSSTQPEIDEGPPSAQLPLSILGASAPKKETSTRVNIEDLLSLGGDEPAPAPSPASLDWNTGTGPLWETPEPEPVAPAPVAVAQAPAGASRPPPPRRGRSEPPVDDPFALPATTAPSVVAPGEPSPAKATGKTKTESRKATSIAPAPSTTATTISPASRTTSLAPPSPSPARRSPGLLIGGALGLVALGALGMRALGGGSSNDTTTHAVTTTATTTATATTTTTATTTATDTSAAAATTATAEPTTPPPADTSKADTSKADTSKADTKAETSKPDTKADTSKADTSKADTKADTSKADTSKPDAKSDGKKPDSTTGSSPGVPIPPLPPASGTAEFNKDAARGALSSAAGTAAGCGTADGPKGTARVQITFATSGRVTQALIQGPPFAGTPVGGCIARAFRSASVPPFSGDPVTTSKTVSIQ